MTNLRAVCGAADDPAALEALDVFTGRWNSHMTTGRAGGLHRPPLGPITSRAYRLIEKLSLA